MVVVRGEHGSGPQLRLRISGALLLAVSAGIDPDLYLTGYRNIPAIGWLFLLQVIAGIRADHSGAGDLQPPGCRRERGARVVHPRRLPVAVRIGLFGFKEIRTRPGIAAGLIEVAAFATLALAAVTADPACHSDAHPPGPGPERDVPGGRCGQAVSVAVLGLLGVAIVSAGGAPLAAAVFGATLKTASIGSVHVLTNADGRPLYWFAPGTSTSSVAVPFLRYLLATGIR